MEFTYYGYNLFGIAVPFGIESHSLHGKYSRGEYVVGHNKESNTYYVVRPYSYHKIDEAAYIIHWIQTGDYIKFGTDPFRKTASEWEKYSKEIWIQHNQKGE